MMNLYIWGFASTIVFKSFISISGGYKNYLGSFMRII